MVDVSIIIPANNEEDNIPILVESLKELFNYDFSFEAIIVDDGSSDKTWSEILKAEKTNSFIKKVRHYKRLGITQSLITGFSQAKGNVFVFFPADMQYEVKAIKDLVQPILNDESDIVTGWKQGKYKKQFVSSIYNALSRILFKVPVHDLNSIKAFRKEIFEDIPLRKDWHRYMIVLAYNKGFRIDEVKVRLFERRFGKSKFGILRVPIGVLDMVSVKLLTSFSQKPMLLFGTLGGVSLFTGIIIGIFALIERFFFNTGMRPLIYLVMLLTLSGLLLFSIGFLAELIAENKQAIEWRRFNKKD